MPNMTLAIPDELHSLVKQRSEINWSEVARQAMWKQAKKLQLLEELLKDSKLQDADVDKLDHAIKAAKKRKQK